MRGYIYGLKCVCGCDRADIRYVGQTVLALHTRLTNHRSQARFGTSTPVYHWMRKHGVDNIRIVLLEEVESDLDDREIWWIANTPNILNLSPGGGIGDALRGGKRPDISELMSGSSHPATHLTESLVSKMRAEYTQTRGEVSRLAKKYGVTVSTMSDILRGNTWRHVGGAKGSVTKKRVRLREEDVRTIRKRREAGETLNAIARDYDTSEANVLMICTRKTWKHVQ